MRKSRLGTYCYNKATGGDKTNDLDSLYFMGERRERARGSERTWLKDDPGFQTRRPLYQILESLSYLGSINPSL